MNPELLENIQYTYILKYSIERIWILIKNISILSLIGGQKCNPIYINGNNNLIGSEFIGLFIEKYPYNGKIDKMLEIPGYKKIKWIFNFENGGLLHLKIELFKVTEDNTTVSIISCKNNKISDEIMKIINEKKQKYYETIETILQESVIDLIQYESGIISGSMEDIWEFVTNITKLKMIAPLINFDGNEDIKIIKYCDILICKLDNNTKQITIKVLVINKNEKWNKWVYILQLLKNQHIPSQKLIVELTKINQKDCQLSILNKFDEYADNDYIQQISKKKKYIINSIKDYLENYKN
jgi:hypothetical protein